MGKKSKHHYIYASARSTQVGRMMCSVCNQKIVEGDYRYYETEEAYVPQHRACCANDPYWAKQDAEEAAALAYREAFRAACKEFVEKWGLPDEDDFTEFRQHSPFASQR